MLSVDASDVSDAAEVSVVPVPKILDSEGNNTESTIRTARMIITTAIQRLLTGAPEEVLLFCFAAGSLGVRDETVLTLLAERDDLLSAF